MFRVVPQGAEPGLPAPLQVHKRLWRPLTLVPCLRPSRHHSVNMSVNSTASAQVESLERLRQADGAGPAHAEGLAEDAIAWASLHGLVCLFGHRQACSNNPSFDTALINMFRETNSCIYRTHTPSRIH